MAARTKVAKANDISPRMLNEDGFLNSVIEAFRIYNKANYESFLVPYCAVTDIEQRKKVMEEDKMVDLFVIIRKHQSKQEL